MATSTRYFCVPFKKRYVETKARRLSLHFALFAAVLAFAQIARAQDLQITLTPFTAPFTNGVTHASPSSISFNVTNRRSGTNLRQIEFALPRGYSAEGGYASGWIAEVTEDWWSPTIRFRVADCGQSGVTTGATATFRVDVVAPDGNQRNDTSDTLSSVTPSDPCGGPTGWTVTSTSNYRVPRKVLAIAAAASPSSGASPLSASVTFTVTNKSSTTKSGVTIQTPTVTANNGGTYTATGCSPASVNLSSGASGTFTCGYTLTAGSAGSSQFTFASTASGSSATSVGAVSNTILLGNATATFAFDKLVAAQGEEVRATLLVSNNTSGSITVTPPAYVELGLEGIERADGTSDPGTAVVTAGSTGAFVYTFTVTGAVSSMYVASGTATTTAGPTNLAVTPAGQVSVVQIEMTPIAIVKSRATTPYSFVVAVTNRGSTPITRLDFVNPQNNTWTGLADAGGSSMSYWWKSTEGTTDTLIYDGEIDTNETGTINFQFNDIPLVGVTTPYMFRVTVYVNDSWTGRDYDVVIVDAVPIDDVGGLSILSTATGQLLTWTNTSREDAVHDGVVVFRANAPAVPAIPVDGTDYSGDPSALYFDYNGSTVESLEDPVVGTYNYRVCNHDANLIYSNCNTGFWNNAGWLDSAVAPADGWSHNLGGQMLLRPGVIPGGRVGVVNNVPIVNVLDVASGEKVFPAVSLPAIPSVGTPMAQLEDGSRILFAADQAGTVTAVDVDYGDNPWLVDVVLPDESFVAGVSGILHRQASATFQENYDTDILLLGSTTGNLFALDASTGNSIWTIDVGSPIRALVKYIPATNFIYLATDDGGIIAYDLSTSNGLGDPPVLATGWTNPNPAGSYSLACSGSAQLLCVDRSGLLQVVDRSTGSVVASSSVGFNSPNYVTSIPGAVLVSNARSIAKLTLSGDQLADPITWTPGPILSAPLVFMSAGLAYAGGSDSALHKLSLATMTESASVSVVSQASQSSTVNLGFPNYDTTNELFLFGSSDGHLWAVKYF